MLVLHSDSVFIISFSSRTHLFHAPQPPTRADEGGRAAGKEESKSSVRELNEGRMF